MIIFNSRVSTALWLSIKTVMLTLEELFPFDLPLKMHQWIKNNNYTTVIGYLDSYFEYFKCCVTRYCGSLWQFSWYSWISFLSITGTFHVYHCFYKSPWQVCWQSWIPLFSSTCPFQVCHFLLWTVSSTLFNLSYSCEFLLVPNGLLLLYYNSRAISIRSFPHSSYCPHPQNPLISQNFSEVWPWTSLWVSPSLSH